VGPQPIQTRYSELDPVDLAALDLATLPSPGAAAGVAEGIPALAIGAGAAVTEAPLGGGNSSVKDAGPSGLAASVALRVATDFNNSASFSAEPTRYGLAG
jgi:hypothetical protein